MFVVMSYFLDSSPLTGIVIYGSVEYVFGEKAMGCHVV